MIGGGGATVGGRTVPEQIDWAVVYWNLVDIKNDLTRGARRAAWRHRWALGAAAAAGIAYAVTRPWIELAEGSCAAGISPHPEPGVSGRLRESRSLLSLRAARRAAMRQPPRGDHAPLRRRRHFRESVSKSDFERKRRRRSTTRESEV